MSLLERIDYLLSDLENYDCEEEELVRIVTDINEILGEEYFSSLDGSLIPNKPDPNKKLKEKATRIILDEVEDFRNNPVYQNLVQTYNDNSQEELVRLIPRVFPRLNRPGSNFNALYHGISISENTSVSDYVDLAVKILEEGLLPSPHGRHHSMDENIRPIYAVSDPDETHGILFFKFYPTQEGYAVFNPGFESEGLIYTPRLKIPIELLLKSEQYFKRNIRIENGRDNKEEEFRDEVERTLNKIGIAYNINQPKRF
jgi:hypothetical protein